MFPSHLWQYSPEQVAADFQISLPEAQEVVCAALLGEYEALHLDLDRLTWQFETTAVLFEVPFDWEPWVASRRIMSKVLGKAQSGSVT